MTALLIIGAGVGAATLALAERNAVLLMACMVVIDMVDNLCECAAVVACTMLVMRKKSKDKKGGRICSLFAGCGNAADTLDSIRLTGSSGWLDSTTYTPQQ